MGVPFPSYKEGELKRTKDRIIAREGDLISAETTTEERVTILAELKDLVDENGRLDAEIRQFIQFIEDRAVHEQKQQEYESMPRGFGILEASPSRVAAPVPRFALLLLWHSQIDANTCTVRVATIVAAAPIAMVHIAALACRGIAAIKGQLWRCV